MALSEHCEDVPLESGSVHWSTAKMYHCEDAPLRSTAKMYHWNVALSTGTPRKSVKSHPSHSATAGTKRQRSSGKSESYKK